jgi:uncharacterized protein (TIGR02444 family)
MLTPADLCQTRAAPVDPMMESLMPTIPGTIPDRASRTSLWQFSLQVYRKPGVAQACVALQDAHGVDVNLLLCLLWLAADRRRLPAAQIELLDKGVAHWRQAAVIPLRRLRRLLKGGVSLGDAPAVEGFRVRVKSVELEAERLQQQELQALASSMRSVEEDASSASAAAGSIAAYQSLLGCEFERDLVAILLASMPDEHRTT